MGLPTAMLSATQILATAWWTGASAGYAFVVAPIVAHEAGDVDLQARITSKSLQTVVNTAYVANGISIVCAALQAIEVIERRNDIPRACCGVGALVALIKFKHGVLPKMTRLQEAMGGSVRALSNDDPQRVAYRALHTRSTQVFGTALLLGIAQLVLGAIRSK